MQGCRGPESPLQSGFQGPQLHPYAAVAGCTGDHGMQPPPGAWLIHSVPSTPIE